MTRKTLATIAVLLALALTGAGAAFYADVGAAPGGTDDRERLTEYDTGTPLGTAGSGERPDTDSSTAPFSFTVETIEECGHTCRDVTASLHNQQDEPAGNVTVFTRIYAGEDHTAEEDLVWTGKEEVGTLEAGGTHTGTERVELGLSEALKVENNGGEVTIVTTVRTSEQTVTLEDSRQVA